MVVLIITRRAMESDVNGMLWHISVYHFPACLQLFRFGGKVSRGLPASGYSAKPFLRQLLHPGCFDITGHNQAGICRRIIRGKELLYIVHLCLFDVGKLLTDGSPPVRMHLIGQRPQTQPHIAVRLVEVTLFKFFTYHIALHVEALFAESERE